MGCSFTPPFFTNFTFEFIFNVFRVRSTPLQSSLCWLLRVQNQEKRYPRLFSRIQKLPSLCSVPSRRLSGGSSSRSNFRMEFSFLDRDLFLYFIFTNNFKIYSTIFKFQIRKEFLIFNFYQYLPIIEEVA